MGAHARPFYEVDCVRLLIKTPLFCLLIWLSMGNVDSNYRSFDRLRASMQRYAWVPFPEDECIAQSVFLNQVQSRAGEPGNFYPKSRTHLVWVYTLSYKNWRWCSNIVQYCNCLSIESSRFTELFPVLVGMDYGRLCDTSCYTGLQQQQLKRKEEVYLCICLFNTSINFLVYSKINIIHFVIISIFSVLQWVFYNRLCYNLHADSIVWYILRHSSNSSRFLNKSCRSAGRLVNFTNGPEELEGDGL